MQPERWRRIDEIFHSTLKVGEHRRAAFLNEVCAGDQDLRRELDRLLAGDCEADSFMESPALEVAAAALSPKAPGEPDGPVDQRAGEMVAHCRILCRIGSGGMGVVYKAEDLRLGRLVALKFLSEDLAFDPGAVQRFAREARAASSLNHNNICTIYGVEEHHGQPMIVMELLEGVSLREKIRAGPVALGEVLDFGIQISGALEAAHAKGIVHRDIKPGNIFVTEGSRIKILDFGLAKMIPTGTGEKQLEEESLTGQGIITGTTSYMSPEQACGEAIDARSDLFSLGAVLYELATGTQPFERRNATLTIDAILHARPPAPSSLNPALPVELDTIVAKLLEKDRGLRYQQAADVRADWKRLVLTPAARIQPRTTARTRWLAGGACVVILGGAAGMFLRPHRPPALTAKDTIVLADFENATGDPVFDGTLRQGLTLQLEQSPYLSVVPDGRIQRTLRLMGQSKDARLTPDLAREICERNASAAVLEGSIARLGSQYVLGLRARNCRTGDILDAQQLQVASKEEVLNALGQIASKFRTRAGESLSTVERYSTPLEDAATSSLEALKAYSMGWKVFNTNGPPAALPFFKRATEIDPKFAAAHAWLGWRYVEVGDPGLARASIVKARELRDRASDQERFAIDFSYDRWVTRNLVKAHQTCELWAQTYPRDLHPHSFLAGGISVGLGKFESAAAGAKKALELDPDHAFAYRNLAANYIYRDRLGEAQTTIRQASDRKLDMPDFLELRYHIAFLKDDQPEMQRLAVLGQDKPGADDWMCDLESSVLAYSGRLQQARRKSRRAVTLALQGAHHEKAAMYEAGGAVREILFGNATDARRSAAAALEFSDDRDAKYGAALAFALAGDSSRSQILADDLEKRFPEDTIVRFSYLPAIRALLALHLHEPSHAIELLQASVSYELGKIDGSCGGGSLYPIYVRGLAHLAARHGSEAAAEFRKILDHRGIVLTEPIGALARLQLGRAFLVAGDPAKAKAAYQDFLTLWRDADPDIPILKEAKAEYARLQ